MTVSGWALWLTGLPAAGKTTLARALLERLAGAGIVAALLDSDELRPILAPAAAYGDAGRDEFYLRLAQLAQLLTRDGVNVLIAATANRRAYRERARQLLPRFAEVWVCCPPAICRGRDSKGLYAAAAAAAIAGLPGAGADYEEPLAPELTVDNNLLSAAEAVEAIVAGVPFLAGQMAAARTQAG